MKNQLVLLNDDSEGYESLYLNGLQIAEGNPIQEGEDRIKFMARLGKEKGFTLDEFSECETIVADEKTQTEWQDNGSAPYKLEDVNSL